MLTQKSLGGLRETWAPKGKIRVPAEVLGSGKGVVSRERGGENEKFRDGIAV